MVFGGPLAEHMAIHIALMNAAAPVVALLVQCVGALPFRRLGGALGAATVAQVALLWAWHAPSALSWALINPGSHAVMQVSLFLAALWFWCAVLSAVGNRRWRAIFALLLTGKLFCLLGVLLVFAPRALYPALTATHGRGASSLVGPALADQQLAGLLMVVACPLSYVLAGTIIAARWVTQLDATGGIPQPGRHTGPLAAE